MSLPTRHQAFHSVQNDYECMQICFPKVNIAGAIELGKHRASLAGCSDDHFLPIARIIGRLHPGCYVPTFFKGG